MRTHVALQLALAAWLLLTCAFATGVPWRSETGYEVWFRLKPGETQTVRVRLTPAELRYYNLETASVAELDSAS